jgi:hypothetical protein
MKNTKKIYLIFLILLSTVIKGAIINVTTYTGLTVENNNTYILKNIITDKGFPFKSGIAYENIIISGKLLYTGNARAINFGGNNITLRDLDVEATENASACIEFWNSKNILFERVNARGSKWIVRGFNDTNTIIRNCSLYDSWDDAVYIENSRNTEIAFCLFKNYNSGYWKENSGGGDGVQLAGDNGFVWIHDNYFDKVQNGNKFNVIIGETTKNGHTSLDDSALIEGNIFNARPHEQTDIEDTINGHIIMGSSNLYLKPMANVIVRYNHFYGGSNAIFTFGSTTAIYKLIVENNEFVNQKEAICFGAGWNIIVKNNTFKEGLITYLSHDGTGDLITKNIFYGLYNPHVGLYNGYEFVDNLIDPETIPNGYGNTTSEIIKTITIYETIPVYLDTINVGAIIDINMKDYLSRVKPQPLKLTIQNE